MPALEVRVICEQCKSVSASGLWLILQRNKPPRREKLCAQCGLVYTKPFTDPMTIFVHLLQTYGTDFVPPEPKPLAEKLAQALMMLNSIPARRQCSVHPSLRVRLP